MSQQWPRRRFAYMPICLALAVAVLATAPQSASAQIQDQSSLKFVPGDVAFYSSSLRLKEQFDDFVNSNAFARMREIPVMQMLEQQWENPENPQVAMAKGMLQGPMFKPVIDVMKDAVSNEIFVYGDAGYAEMLVLFNEINNASQMANIESLSSGRSSQEILGERIVQLLSEHDMRVPDTVIGFKLMNPQAADQLLQQLEFMLSQQLSQIPEMQGRFSRETIGDADYLSLRLDGGMVPWDEMPPDVAQMIAPIQDQLRDMTLEINIGIRDDYMLVSFGDSNEHLGALGQGPLLYDRDEFQPLRDYADEPITSVGYASEDFMQIAGSAERQFRDLGNMFQAMLEEAPFPPDLREEMRADIDNFVDDIVRYMPEPGAAMGFSYRTPRGYESYSYDWSQNTGLDASQPLTILSHVGGQPIMFYAARGVSRPEDYDVMVRWLKRGFYYGEQMAMAEMGDQERQMFTQIKAELMPFFERLNEVTREKLVPAFEDGQGAIVIDAKTTSQQWFMMMPPSQQPLPIPEIGLVYGVSDADLVREASSEYYEIAQEFMDRLHELSQEGVIPEPVPQIQIPSPMTRDTGAGTVYYYELPAEWGVDQQIAPNAGLNESVLVMSVVPKMTSRLLQESSLTAGGPLDDVNRPLAAAGYFHFEGFVDMLIPWIDYAGMVAGGFQASTESAAAQPSPEAVIQQVKMFLEVAKCFRGIASVTYAEGDAMVTHSEWHFEDLE